MQISHHPASLTPQIKTYAWPFHFYISRRTRLVSMDGNWTRTRGRPEASSYALRVIRAGDSDHDATRPRSAASAEAASARGAFARRARRASRCVPPSTTWACRAAAHLRMDQPPQRTRHPNLLLVVDDDHGWDMWPRERSATAGSTQHNIERVLPTFTRLFREEGVTLNHFYAHPKCAPSRQSFMSGRWDWHGTQRNDACHAVSSTYRLMSDVLREAGCDHSPCSNSACLRRSGRVA